MHRHVLSSHQPQTRLLPPGLIYISVAIYLLGGIGPNAGLAALAVLTLLIGCASLWRPGEAPILLFIFSFQWLQASIAIFHSNWLGLDIAEYSAVSRELTTSTIITLFGLIVLALGMHLGAGAVNREVLMRARSLAMSVPLPKWTWLWVYATSAGIAAGMLMWSIPGLSQVFLAAANLKWAFYFMLAYASFIRLGTAGPHLLMAFTIELGQGIGGYFSDFRTVIFVTLVAAVAANVRVTLLRAAIITALCSLLVFLAIVWTVIKPDFRNFVSGGSGEQVIAVDFAARMTKLEELVGELDQQQLAKGLDALMRRLSSVEYLGAVLTYVPAYVPHTNGDIWLDAIARPFMPRILFSEKSVIDDTQRTTTFTGIYTENYQTTSISLGYMAEAYIDFGIVGMMAPIFGFGIFLGCIHRFFHKWNRSRGLLGMATAVTILLVGFDLGSSVTKTIGGLVVVSLVALGMTGYVSSWLNIQSRASKRDGYA